MTDAPTQPLPEQPAEADADPEQTADAPTADDRYEGVEYEASPRRGRRTGAVRREPVPADHWEVDHDANTITLITADGDSMVVPLDRSLVEALLDGLPETDYPSSYDDTDEQHADADYDDEGYGDSDDDEDDDEGLRGSRLVKASGWSTASEWWEVLPPRWKNILIGVPVAFVVLVIVIRLITG